MSGTFDHLSSGTSEAAWGALLARLRSGPPLAPPGERSRLVVLAAHPDDETLGAGGVIAAAARAGARIDVVVATDGEASHPRSPSHSREQLAGLRRREVYAALSVLAPDAEVTLLGLPDGKLTDHGEELVATLDAVAADCTHLVTPWERDGHPDHDACGRAGAVVAQRRRLRHWQYPVWAWHWADPETGELPEDTMRGFPLDEQVRAVKARALHCHLSQHRALSDAEGDEPILGPEMQEHFRREVEVFVVPDNSDATSSTYFDDLYADRPDPWGLEDRFYERRKRAAILAALTRPRFREAFEPGCATGLLTRELARRCDRVVAWDLADAALAQARARLADAPHVEFAPGRIPDQWPSGRFDLIVLSEVGYYCPDLHVLADRVHGSLAEDGVLVACHWRHPAPKHPHAAGEVHAVLGTGRHLVVSHVEDDFLLQVWTRTGESVASAEGIVRPR